MIKKMKDEYDLDLIELGDYYNDLVKLFLYKNALLEDFINKDCDSDIEYVNYLLTKKILQMKG